jgi:hypothetical protein
MIYHSSSLGFDFHIPIDFEFNVLFPLIFSVLHCNSIETSWFLLMMHDSPLTEEKSMQSGLDTRISMFHPPVSAQSASALPKKYIKILEPKLKRFELFGFRCSLTGPRG